MSERSRYDRVRRILGLVAVVGAIALLVRQGCGASGSSATLRLRFGDAGGEIRSVRVDVFADSGDSVAFYQRAFPSGAPERVDIPVTFPAEGEYRAEVLIERPGAPLRVTRTLLVEDDTTISIDLQESLAAPPAGVSR